MGSARFGQVRFQAYPQDHEPCHIHAFIGSGEVIIELRTADQTVVLADRDDNVNGAKRSEVRRVLDTARDHFDELIAKWEEMHD